jgi:hypothetical protein
MLSVEGINLNDLDVQLFYVPDKYNIPLFPHSKLCFGRVYGLQIMHYAKLSVEL